METIDITYHFTFPEHREESYAVHLECKTLSILDDVPASLPDWTALSFHQCSNCPLDEKTHPQCPLAVRLVGIIDLFGHVTSYTEIVVKVETPERVIAKKTSAQQGLSALMGLVMATSGCPHTAFFKPMAAYHLPMASVDETIYRAASMYALSQYYVFKKGGKPDFALKGLQELYSKIEVLNVHMARRIRAVIHQDAAVNALVILDFFAKNMTCLIEDKLNEFIPLFDVYTS